MGKADRQERKMTGRMKTRSMKLSYTESLRLVEAPTLSDVTSATNVVGHEARQRKRQGAGVPEVGDIGTRTPRKRQRQRTGTD